MESTDNYNATQKFGMHQIFATTVNELSFILVVNTNSIFTKCISTDYVPI